MSCEAISTESPTPARSSVISARRIRKSRSRWYLVSIVETSCARAVSPAPCSDSFKTASCLATTPSRTDFARFFLPLLLLIVPEGMLLNVGEKGWKQKQEVLCRTAGFN